MSQRGASVEISAYADFRPRKRFGLYQHEHCEYRKNANGQDACKREQRLVDATKPRLDRVPEIQASKLVVGRRHPVHRQRPLAFVPYGCDCEPNIRDAANRSRVAFAKCGPKLFLPC